MRNAAQPTVILASLLTAAVAADAGVNLLSNGSFETPVVGGNFATISGSNLTGWTVVNNVDLINALWDAAEGSQSVDLNGSFTAGVTQTFATQAGARYRVRYAVSENFFGTDNKTLDVVWNGTVVRSETIVHNGARTPTNMLWEYRDLFVTASSSSSTLGFISTTGAMPGSQGVAPFYGPALDDVSVTLAPPSSCPWDLNGDQAINTADLTRFLSTFGQSVPAGTSGDFNGDGVVNVADLTQFLSRFGQACP